MHVAFQFLLQEKILLVQGSAFNVDDKQHLRVVFLPRKDTLEGKTCVVSGSGNVAIYTIEKINQLGGKVIACSDSNGYVYHKSGIDFELVKQLKEVERRRIKDYVEHHADAKYVADGNIWEIPCEIAFPSATENEVTGKDAEMLVKNGCIAVGEGANMPTTPEGVKVFLESGIAYGPGKAANAGGVATSALEMQQNAARDSWSFEYTEKRLAEIMSRIHALCDETANEFGTPGNLVNGANIAGFMKVARAMVSLGLV